MKILISSCLLGKNCKYNAGNNLNKILLELSSEFEFIEVCPEVLGGLSTPRPPAEIQSEKVITKYNDDVTQEFIKGANITLEIAKQYNCKIAILKESSPSCGSNYIYDGSFTSKKIKGMGITAKLLKENGIEVFSEENFTAIDIFKKQ